MRVKDEIKKAVDMYGASLCGTPIATGYADIYRKCEKKLARNAHYRRIFVVTESVFSTEGSIAPFDEIKGLCDKYKVIPVIDDSHGISVIGKSGRGILEEKGISHFKGIYTASLGKAIAHAGGMITGSKKFIDYIRYSTPGLIYSTALPPAIIAGICKVLDIIQSDFNTLSSRMWEYKKMIQSALSKAGYHLSNGEAPITSINCNSTHDTILLTKKLFMEHIIATPFIPPSVPPGSGKVRIIAGANRKGYPVIIVLILPPLILAAVRISDWERHLRVWRTVGFGNEWGIH
ncbi:MAG: pyridoxal phosphate-dependent aminotransferase family protein [Spirochaetales bacterium]|nr:pyridoxal phosphate-dependent aminotransferase family protein [Spirochaetales bacterium]